MTMADVFAVTFFVVGLFAALPAVGLLLQALLPRAVSRARDGVLARPGRSLLLGLPLVLLLVVAPLFALQSPSPPAKAAGMLLLLAGVALGAPGLAGLAAAVGSRLPTPADDGSPWRALVRGAVCLEIPLAIPVVGWFGLVPLGLALGMGALVAPGSPAAGEAPEPATEPAA
jgi:hypothetical protein